MSKWRLHLWKNLTQWRLKKQRFKVPEICLFFLGKYILRETKGSCKWETLRCKNIQQIQFCLHPSVRFVANKICFREVSRFLKYILLPRQMFCEKQRGKHFREKMFLQQLMFPSLWKALESTRIDERWNSNSHLTAWNSCDSIKSYLCLKYLQKYSSEFSLRI